MAPREPLVDERETQDPWSHGQGTSRQRVQRAGRGHGDGGGSQLDQDQGHLLDAVYAHQLGDGVVGEGGHHPRRHAVGRCRRQQVGDHGAGVPPQMTPSPLPVLPAGTKGDAGEDERRATPGVGDLVAASEGRQGVVQGVVVVHARADEVELDGVEVAGRHGGPEPHALLPSEPTRREPGDTRREEQQRSQQLVVESAGRPVTSREHLGGRHRRSDDRAWQAHRAEIGVGLERAGAVGGIQRAKRDQSFRVAGCLAVAGRVVQHVHRARVAHSSILVRNWPQPEPAKMVV